MTDTPPADVLSRALDRALASTTPDPLSDGAFVRVSRDTFLDRCLRGVALPEHADDFVDAWHARGEDDRTLREALGLTPEEYARFVVDPAVMHQAVRDRLTARVRTALAPLAGLAVTPELLAEALRALREHLP
jgi:hypothetical protein